jgi:hypothetical protein
VKGTEARDSRSFFHESTPYGTLRHTLIFFRIRFEIRRDVRIERCSSGSDTLQNREKKFSSETFSGWIVNSLGSVQNRYLHAKLVEKISPKKVWHALENFWGCGVVNSAARSDIPWKNQPSHQTPLNKFPQDTQPTEQKLRRVWHPWNTFQRCLAPRQTFTRILVVR